MSNQTDKWVVESAGIGWWDLGKGMDPRAKRRCELYGLDTNHVVRDICQDDFYKFDYIIATDDTDLSFLHLEAPSDNTAQLALLGSFNSKAKFSGTKNLPDPFFLKAKDLNDALDDIIHRGYWYLLGFLDTMGVQVPTTTTTEKITFTTTRKIRSSTIDAHILKMSALMANVTQTKFRDRKTVKSTHRKIH